MSVSVVLKNVAKSTGEGPHWDAATKSLLHVDIFAGDIHRWDFNTGVDEIAHFDAPVSLIVPRRSGGYVISVDRQLLQYDWNTEETLTYAEVEKNTQNKFNDGKCDASGRLWAGTMGFMREPGKPDRETSHLYSLDKEHVLRTHLDKITISNGMAWTQDSRIMYYIDSDPGKIWAYDFDLNAGIMSNQRTVFADAVGTHWFPDGMTIDTEGKLWVACYGDGRVVRLDPEVGKVLQSIDIPAERVTSVCFGGDNLDELYVTSSRSHYSEAQLAKQPLAGSLFKITGLGSKGLPANIFEG